MIAIGLEDGIGDLRPGHWQTLTDVQIGRQVFDTLFEYSPQLALVPALAAAAEPSGDGRRWRIRLRPDVRFHDGTPLRADAVAEQFRRRHCFTIGIARDLEDVRAEGSEDVVFLFRTPFASLLDRLTMPAAVVVSPSHAGSGAYRMDDAAGTIIALRSVDSWRASADASRDVRMVLFRSVAEQWKAAVDGRVDVATKVPYAALHQDADPGACLARHACVALGVSAMLLNVRRAPFDRLERRLAVRGAIDTAELVRAASAGTGTAASGLISPASPFFHAPDGAAGPASARGISWRFELLASAGYSSVWLQVLGEQLARSGITFDVVTLPPATLRARMDAAEFEAVLVGLPGSPDPDWMFTYMFHSRSRGNCTGFDDPALDRTLDTARMTMAFEERRRLYAEAERLLRALAPAVFLRHGYSSIAHAPHIRGMHAHPDSYVRLDGVTTIRMS